MDANHLLQGLIVYLCFIPVLTFHEFAHAWVAWKCGDDTARLLGRVTFNPLAHMELLGTVILPLMAVFLTAANSALGAFIIGWGKPVPVNPYNFRHRRRDDTLVALAGPAMNLVLALVVLAIAKLSMPLQVLSLTKALVLLAQISLCLCFFNLLPIPPLDGSHFLKNALHMSDETYFRLSQFGLVLVIVAINLPMVRHLLASLTSETFYLMCQIVRLY